MRLAGNRPMIAVVATLLAFPALVQAGSAAKRHDGFFLRLAAGLGFAGTSIDLDIDTGGSGDTSLYDLGGDSNIAIGGVVGTNLAVHGTLWGWLVNDPDVELNGDDVGEFNGDLSMGALGAGITYYFMPSNLYLTASLGVGKLNFDADNVGEADTDWGPALDLGLGKEWWVSRNWGLGLAGALGLFSFDDPDVSENWSGYSFAVRFSATFN